MMSADVFSHTHADEIQTMQFFSECRNTLTRLFFHHCRAVTGSSRGAKQRVTIADDVSKNPTAPTTWTLFSQKRRLFVHLVCTATVVSIQHEVTVNAEPGS